MTRPHTLTQMERLLTRLEGDHSPYTPGEATRLGALRDGLAVLAGKAMKGPPTGDHRQRLAKHGARQAAIGKN